MSWPEKNTDRYTSTFHGVPTTSRRIELDTITILFWNPHSTAFIKVTQPITVGRSCDSENCWRINTLITSSKDNNEYPVISRFSGILQFAVVWSVIAFGPWSLTPSSISTCQLAKRVSKTCNKGRSYSPHLTKHRPITFTSFPYGWPSTAANWHMTDIKTKFCNFKTLNRTPISICRDIHCKMMVIRLSTLYSHTVTSKTGWIQNRGMVCTQDKRVEVGWNKVML